MKRILCLFLLPLLAACAGAGVPLPRWQADVTHPVTDDVILRINPGTTREQVVAMIGPPLHVMEFSRRRETSWEYRFVDTWGYPSYLFVNFDPAGIVVSRHTQRVESNRDSRSP